MKSWVDEKYSENPRIWKYLKMKESKISKKAKTILETFLDPQAAINDCEIAMNPNTGDSVDTMEKFSANLENIHS